jgi:ribosome biogenesis protein BRX1
MASVYKSLSKSNGHKEETTTSGVKRNKQKVLILSSRGVTYRFVSFLTVLHKDMRLTYYRHRHLLNDIYSLLPHSRKDVKLDTKTKLYQLNELAELYTCNNVFFFEARKTRDLYLWMSKAPNGPTVKMHMQNCTYYPKHANRPS